MLGAIKDAFMPEQDRRGQVDGHARTGHLLSVVVDEAHRERVEELLERDGATMISSAA